MDKKVSRLILKENDVLVCHIPQEFWNERNIKAIYMDLRKKLLPRKNKVVILPQGINLSVLGEKEIEEHISQVDIWRLFDNGVTEEE